MSSSQLNFLQNVSRPLGTRPVLGVSSEKLAFPVTAYLQSTTSHSPHLLLGGRRCPTSQQAMQGPDNSPGCKAT